MLEADVKVPLGAFDLHIDDEVLDAGVTAVFGPSGSGKTTLLRVIAGFEPATGRVAFGGDVWLDTQRGINVPPHRRPVGFMFQDARLFSHLSVAQNLQYAFKRQSSTKIDLAGAIEVLDLENLLERHTRDLSGGERQRVGLARTVLSGPDLLLLDEPLSALDDERKQDILPYVESLASTLHIPTLYVSHSVDEVARLADRVLILNEGKVLAIGPPADVLERLDLQDVTGRFEAGVVIETHVAGHDPGFQLTQLDFDGQSIVMPMVGHLTIGTRVRIRIRARDVALALQRPDAISIRNVLEGHVTDVVEEATSAYAEVFVEVGGQRLRSRITRAAVHALGLQRGHAVFALIKSVTFDRAAG